MDTILPAAPATDLPNRSDGLTPNVGFSDQLPAPPPPPPREPTDAEIDQQIAAMPAPLIPIPSLEELRAKFDELDTKTLVLGMAGLLTAVLIFKK
jgi:hypothetical protein